MMILFYGITTAVIVMLLLLFKSHRSLNFLSCIHAGIYVLMTTMILVTQKLPIIINQYQFMDRLSLYEILISSGIFFLAALYARGYIDSLTKAGDMNPRNSNLFYTAFNILLCLVTLALVSNNLALFWIFLELTTITSAILMVTLNAKENIVAALEYVFIASTAMLFSLIGLILVYTISKTVGTGTLDWTTLMNEASAFPPGILMLSFVLLLIGFAAKSGIAPFHFWLPYTYAKAPSVVTVIMSGSISNLGMYGIIRMFAIMHRTPEAGLASWVLIIFGVASIIISSLTMIPRTNFKKLIALSSVEQNGFMLIGIGLNTPIALFWVLFHTLAHALNKAMLFFSAGILNRQYGTLSIKKIKNALVLQPLASWGLILGGAAILGLPPFALFVSKFFLLMSIGNVSIPLLLIVLFFMLIVAAAFALAFTHMFFSRDERKIPRYPTPMSMKIPILILGILLIALFIEGLMQTGLSDFIVLMVKELMKP
ncbi:hydrogenase membrane subunit [Candidatus Woesearchaeota archaeon]|nr:hydrogenase membrane subunit [Candidatus Woesearchaeota archaeon]